MADVTVEVRDGTRIKIDTDRILGTNSLDWEHTIIKYLLKDRSETSIIVKTETMPDEIRNLR